MLENYDVKPSSPVDPDIQAQCGVNRKVMELVPAEEDDSVDEGTLT